MDRRGPTTSRETVGRRAGSMAGGWLLWWLELLVLSQSEPLITLVSVNVTVPSSLALSCPLSARMLLWLESSLPNPVRKWGPAPVSPHLPP